MIYLLLSVLLMICVFTAYLILLFEFKRDIVKYNSVMPGHFQIPVPGTFKELVSEYQRYSDFWNRYRYEVYNYHIYVTDKEPSDDE